MLGRLWTVCREDTGVRVDGEKEVPRMSQIKHNSLLSEKAAAAGRGGWGVLDAPLGLGKYEGEPLRLCFAAE